MRADAIIRVTIAATVLMLLSGVASVPAGANTVKGTISLPADGGSAGDTVVYLEGKIGTPTPRNAEIDQKDMTFVPHVVAVTVGSAVKFLNSDSVLHNVFSTSSAKRFDLGLFDRGESRSVTFDTEGVVEVRCNVHPKMQAFVVVVPNNYFAQPDERGMFEITDIAPGRYKLRAWHDGLQPAEIWVNVEEAKIRTLELNLRR